ncbi:uracil-DNA glycosylase family protein [Simplicispira psychrophila]|uniref:uracil-DNA glycosylase family protein n=1 Tax=Simplicispira psychrophila TaxID=80882 RepID=UPI000484CE90|nr:uracil-DNA glycosylase family protein [Simplicispira psychrophila]
MSLHLDTRQRAMLQEMGIQVWSPRPAPVPSAAHARATSPHPPPLPKAAGALAQHGQPKNAPTAARTAPPTPPPASTATAPMATVPGTPLAWRLQAPQPVYPAANAPGMSTEAGPCWLLVAEGVAGADPLAGDAGRLLDNMLRALRLHQQPRVFLCWLTPLAADATHPPTTMSCTQTLAQAIADIQPAVVLLMGRPAARAVLGRSEPLGQLRSQAHNACGVPAVATYDAAYLLRAPGAKAGAWDDLCRARALALAPPDTPHPGTR